MVQDAAEGRQPPTPALYATIAVGRSRVAADKQLRDSVERYYRTPLQAVARAQAMRAGSAAEIADWLAGYVEAGARHLVARVVDGESGRAVTQLAREIAPRLRTGAATAA